MKCALTFPVRFNSRRDPGGLCAKYRCATDGVGRRGYGCAFDSATHVRPGSESRAGHIAPGVVKSWGCTGSTSIRFPLMTGCDVQRGAPGTRRVAAGVPDRRSPALGVSFALKGICAHRARSEGRRPSVRRSCGVLRPAHNKRPQITQQKPIGTGANETVVKPNFSPPQGEALGKKPVNHQLPSRIRAKQHH